MGQKRRRTSCKKSHSRRSRSRWKQHQRPSALTFLLATVAAAGLPIIGYGLIYSLWLCVLGGLFVLGGLYGWVFEPVDDPNADDHHDDHEDESHAELESAEVTSSGEETTIE